MKFRIAFILLTTLVLAYAARVSAQESSSEAGQTLESLRAQLSSLQDHEADLKIRLEQLNFDLKPENIRRYFNAVGSTRPEELRESRRRELQNEKDCVLAQLDQLAASRAKAYPQSASGSVNPPREPNSGTQTLRVAQTLPSIAKLILFLGWN